MSGGRIAGRDEHGFTPEMQPALRASLRSHRRDEAASDVARADMAERSAADMELVREALAQGCTTAQIAKRYGMRYGRAKRLRQILAGKSPASA